MRTARSHSAMHAMSQCDVSVDERSPVTRQMPVFSSPEDPARKRRSTSAKLGASVRGRTPLRPLALALLNSAGAAASSNCSNEPSELNCGGVAPADVSPMKPAGRGVCPHEHPDRDVGSRSLCLNLGCDGTVRLGWVCDLQLHIPAKTTGTPFGVAQCLENIRLA